MHVLTYSVCIDMTTGTYTHIYTEIYRHIQYKHNQEHTHGYSKRLTTHIHTHTRTHTHSVSIDILMTSDTQPPVLSPLRPQEYLSRAGISETNRNQPPTHLSPLRSPGRADT